MTIQPKIMARTKPILVITMLAGRLSVTAPASTNTKAPALCPQGYKWAPELDDCLDCDVCNTMPETSICPSCKGEESTVVPSEGSIQQVEARSDDTANFYQVQCPSGWEWYPIISDCMSCTVCDDMPDTYICDKCANLKPTKTAHIEPGLIAVIVILSLVTVCSLSIAAWCTWKRRERNNEDDAESEARRPIQATTDPDEIMSGIETTV